MWAEVERRVGQRLQTQRDALLRELSAQLCEYHHSAVHLMADVAEDIAKEWHEPGVAQQTHHAFSHQFHGNLTCCEKQQLGIMSGGLLAGAVRPIANTVKMEQCHDVSWEGAIKCEITSNCEQRAPPSTQQSNNCMLPIPSRSSPRKQTAAGLQPIAHSPHSRSSMGEFLEKRSPVSISNSKLRTFVEGSFFDVITSMMVIACTLMMAVEVQYAGMQAGYVVKSPGYDVPASQEWPHARDILATSHLAFNILFSAELALRIFALRRDACRSRWIHLDAILVIAGWVSDSSGVNPMIMRLVRLLRLGRLLKLLRNSQIVQTLFLMVRSIRASLGCLLWSFSILWFFQIVMAILMGQLVQPTLVDETKDIDVRLKIFSYFGTFSRGVVTMFEITLANWVPSCRLLYDNVSEWFGGIYIAYRCCFMFAIIKVITAVFIAETTRCANSDVELAVQKKVRDRAAFCDKCAELFYHLDADQSGTITWDELELLVTSTILQNILSVLEIDTHDLEAVFSVYDKGDGRFDLQCFTSGLSHVKGPARNIDVLKLAASIDEVNRKVDAILNK